MKLVKYFNEKEAARLTNYTADLQIEGLAGGMVALSQANFHKSRSNCEDTISWTKINKWDYSP